MDPLSDEARDLIARARAAGEAPPPGEQAEVWSALTRRLDGAAPETPPVSRMVWGGVTALAIGAAVMAGLLVGGRGDDPEPAAAVTEAPREIPQDESFEPLAPPLVAPANEALDSVPLLGAPARVHADAEASGDGTPKRPPRAARAKPTVPAESPEPRDADTLVAEMELLEGAQAALRRGDSTAALRLLDAHAKRFPNGVLAAERMAAKVLAHCDADNPQAAREAADRFLARFGQSPLAQRVRTARCLVPVASD